MASTQKKTTSAKTSAAKSKPAEKTPAGKNGKKEPSVKNPLPVYRPNPVARGVGAAVCLFLAILLGLGMFGIHAVVVDFLCDGIKGLVGYGFCLTPFALVIAAVFLLAKREKSVQGRLWCLGLLVLVLGAFLHLLLSPYPYDMGLSTFASLWRDGQNLFSGGVLGGFLAVSFRTWFSGIGAGIIFVLAALALLAGVFHVTPAAFLGWTRRRRARRREEAEEYEEPEDDYYDLPPVQPEPRPEPEPFWSSFLPRRGKKRAPDLPLDDVTPEKAETPPPKESPKEPTREEKAAGTLKGSKAPLFNRKSRVPSPDQVLDELAQEEPAPAAAPVPPAENAPAWQEVGEKEPTRAQQREAIRQESQAVAQTIEQNLETQEKPYVFPPLNLLTAPSGEGAQAAQEELQGTLDRLAGVLTSFGIDGRVTGAVQGPSVTRYEVALEQGVRLNKLTNLSDDVALALGVSNVRIAPVPGKISVVGVEVPNRVVTPVSIREVLESPDFRRHKSSTAFSVGKDISGSYIVGDCAKLPHMLIAGTTGSGKSVCINSIIVSMLYKSTPQELRLIMVDPKMVELGGYNGIPHLLIPVVTDPKKAAGALQWAVTEMMKRYRLFAEAGVRELSAYNQWAGKQEHAEPMPKVVIVIDELADLMLVAAKEVEESICRVAQMGRASGMHLVIATQRPSADVITGLMKANIPSRIAFAVASSLESRIILDTTGAEKLVGKGDMLWFPLGAGKPQRVQGCFISDEEVAAVVDSVKQNSTADYDDTVMEQIEQHVTESEKKGKGASGGYPGGEPAEEQDEMFAAAVDVILELGQASVSMLQRRLKLGYARAARLVDQMEQQGIVGPFEGSKPRQLLITKEQWIQMQEGGEEPSVPPEASPPVEEEILTFDPIPQNYEGE